MSLDQPSAHLYRPKGRDTAAIWLPPRCAASRPRSPPWSRSRRALNAKYLLHVGKIDIRLGVRLGKTQLMTVATLAPPAPARSAAIAPFPKAEVEACLRDELIEAVTAEAGIKGLP